MTFLFNQPIDPNVPNAVVNIVPPAPGAIAGVPTGNIGFVGSASWGPVNSPVSVGPANYSKTFGPVQNRKYDLCTAMACSVLAGGVSFKGVRVTDGTDAAASVIASTATVALTTPGSGFAVDDTISFANGAVVKVGTISASPSPGTPTAVTLVTPPTATTAGSLAQTATSGSGTGASFTFTYTTAITFTSLYTGSLANSDTVTISAGSKASSWKATVYRPGDHTETFDNITGSGNALWLAIASAINSGQNGLRGASTLGVATAGSSAAAPLPQTYGLTGGLDGATGITALMLLGVDGSARTGMYALRSTGPGILVVVDDDTQDTWSAIVGFALSEGYYPMVAGPSGEYTDLTTVAANKASADVDSYAIKVLVGDYLYFNDVTNGIPARLVNPSAFAAGLLASINPNQSGLNKPIFGIAGSQSAAAAHVYAESELSQIGGAGMDLITNPCPGGDYDGLRFGRNGSSNAAINGDNYSRMGPYLAFSIGGSLGQWVGQLQTQQQRLDAIASLDSFLFGLWNPNSPIDSDHWISNPDGTQPYSVEIDDGNNPSGQVALGYENASVIVQLGPVIFQMVVNLQVGQTVQVSTSLALAA